MAKLFSYEPAQNKLRRDFNPGSECLVEDLSHEIDGLLHKATYCMAMV